MTHTLESFRTALERMVADAADGLHELRMLRAHETDQECVTNMNFEFNGLCLALRELDFERYEDVDFTNPDWILSHRSRLK